METSEKIKCKKCSAPIPGKSTEALCPACLMAAALESPEKNENSEFPFELGGYKILGLLGRGGMATVYEAEELATRRRVALKMLGTQLDSPDMRQRFIREGRLAAGINHPNSLYIFGSEEIDGHPVITMEIASGGTLKDLLDKRGPLPVKQAVDAILDVISGLESAHKRGVLHRDIKPSNCFVYPDGSVKVGDFGLSVSTVERADTFVTATGMVMGTPAYAAPEQLRGDTLDLRADIYSVGATLFTLLTNRAPFEGINAVQIVANAMNQEPVLLTDLRKEVRPELARVVAKCLAKQPEGRYPDYAALRNALLPFSSKEPEPAPMKVRAAAGWIDFLCALLLPYVLLMVTVGPEQLLIAPFVEPSLYAARYYFVLFGFGFLYFTIAEGIFGAGVGKFFKGLQVIQPNGQKPGLGRGFIRIFFPIFSIEAVRMPLLMITLSDVEGYMTGWQAFYMVLISNICAWIPILFTLSGKMENGFATAWDKLSGTRVVFKQKGLERPSIGLWNMLSSPAERSGTFGPYEIIDEIIPGEWIIASDPVLRRQVWLLKRVLSEPSDARKNLGRSSRLRWLQKVDTPDATWDAFEATEGIPLRRIVERERAISWGTLRHWLHDLACEIWEATRDNTLPQELSIDYVWITDQGQAVLLDKPWPEKGTPAEKIAVGDIFGQQRFLNTIALNVEKTSLPVHARSVLQNLLNYKFEKLSFLTGILRGLMDKPTKVTSAVRMGALFMLPTYVWIMNFVANFKINISAAESLMDIIPKLIMEKTLLILAIAAIMQLLALPFRTTTGHAIFRLAVINDEGEIASILQSLWRWAIAWLPLILPVGAIVLFGDETPGYFLLTSVIIILWLGAAGYVVFHPNRGLHDRLAGTWVVRQ